MSSPPPPSPPQLIDDDLEQQSQRKNAPSVLPLPSSSSSSSSSRPHPTPPSLKLDTSTTTITSTTNTAWPSSSSSGRYNPPYSSFFFRGGRGSSSSSSPTAAADDVDLPTPRSTKARQCLSIFQTLCLFNTAYPFRPGIFSPILRQIIVSSSSNEGTHNNLVGTLTALAVALDWTLFNLVLISAGYCYFCLASLEEEMVVFQNGVVGRGGDSAAAAAAAGGERGEKGGDLDLEGLGGGDKKRKRGWSWEFTWLPGYFWVLAIVEVVMLQGAVVSEDEVVRTGTAALVVVLGWCLGWSAARPVGVKL